MAEDVDKKTIEAFAKLHNMGMQVTGGRHAGAVLGAAEQLHNNDVRTRVNKLLDFFTEPARGEKYLKDLEDDLVNLIAEREKTARIDELENIDWENGDGGYYWVKKRLAELNQSQDKETK